MAGDIDLELEPVGEDVNRVDDEFEVLLLFPILHPELSLLFCPVES